MPAERFAEALWVVERDRVVRVVGAVLMASGVGRQTIVIRLVGRQTLKVDSINECPCQADDSASVSASVSMSNIAGDSLDLACEPSPTGTPDQSLSGSSRRYDSRVSPPLGKKMFLYG